MIDTEYIENEKDDLERLEEKKFILDKKWIRTPIQKREIKVLEKHIELKKQLIMDLQSWSQKRINN